MRSCNNSTSKIKLSLFVFNCIFVISLMKCTITVNKYCFRPICKYVVLRLVWQNTLKYIFLWPIQTTTQLSLAPLVTTLQSSWKIWVSTRSTSHEIHHYMLRITLWKIESSWWSIKTFGIRISNMYSFMIRFISSENKYHNRNQEDSSCYHGV